MKLELERIYKDYCNNSLEGVKGEDKFIDMICVFVEFRLKLSKESFGGGMFCVDNFLSNICEFDCLMDEWSGVYYGDLCYENYEDLEKLINDSDLEENIKIEILNGYMERNGMDEE